MQAIMWPKSGVNTYLLNIESLVVMQQY